MTSLSSHSMEGLKGLTHLLPEYRPFSVTFGLCALQLLYFFCSLCWGMTAWKPDFCSLYDLGGGFAPAVIKSSHLHRLFLPSLLSSAFPPVLIQWLCQMQFGYALEVSLGSCRFAVMLLLAAVQGNAVAMASMQYQVVTGATGTLFTIMGCQLAWIVRAKQEVNGQVLSRYTVAMTAVCVSALWPYISLLSSLTAFLSGLLLTYSFLPSDAPLDNPHICVRLLSFTLWLFLSLLAFIWIRSLSFTECGDIFYFDREGFLYSSGPECVSFCREY